MSALEQTQGLDQLLNHGGWLRRLARALVHDRDAAEDLVQDTLVAAWQHPPAAGEGETRPWLSRVLRNQAHDQRRSEQRRHRREQSAGALEPSTAPDAEQLIGNLQIHRAVAEVVSALDEPYRQVLVLRYYDGLSAAEVARRLGVPAGTVRWRLKEGLDRVRVQLDARHDGERRRWMAALIPLAGEARPPASWVIAAVTGAALAAAGYMLLPAPTHRSVDPESVVAVSTQVDRRPGAVTGRNPAPPRFTRAPASVRRVVEPVRPGDPDSLMRRLIATAAANDYDGFLEYGDHQFKAAISPALLREVSNALAPVVERGFSAESLGTIRKQEGLIHLWKVQPAGADVDDLLVRMTMDDDKVTGFLVQ